MTQSKTEQIIDEDALIEAAKSTLDESARKIDASTLARLSAVRGEAVDVAISAQLTPLRFTWLVPVGSFASIVAVLGVVVALWVPQTAIVQTPIAMLEDINLLSDVEEIEFYEELDFYEWLVVEAQTVG
ncbi:MAG: hypothetical protein GXP08_16295 [Gammaproteobacteria bacterium]|nr:hypothetical protein [Gammaproteobacteria bacterium]